MTNIILTVDGNIVYDSQSEDNSTTVVLKDTLDDYGVDIKKYERVRKPQEGEYYHFIIANKDGTTTNKDGTPKLEPGIYTSVTSQERMGSYTIYFKDENQLTYPSSQPPVLYTEIKKGGAKRRTKRRRTKRRTKNRKSKRRYYKKI